VSVIRYRPSPVVLRLNDDGSSIADLLAPPRRERTRPRSGRDPETR
jgi:hypothetical protein